MLGVWKLGVHCPGFLCNPGEGNSGGGGVCSWQGSHGTSSDHRPKSRRPSSSSPPPPPTAARPHCGLDAPKFQPRGLFGNCCRKPLRIGTARTFQGTDRFWQRIRSLRGVNARGPPPKEFAGKVKRSDAFWERRFCTHPKAEPYSYLAQRAGKRDLGMLAGRLWSKVLAEELGAGRERGGPGRAGPGRGLGACGWRVAAGRGGARRLGCRRAPRGAKLHPGLARPRPGSPRLQAGDEHPGRCESPC